jgi:hypothetical protein
MLARSDNFEIWAKTWSEIMKESAHDCNSSRELNYDADREEALASLKATYAKFLAPN